MVGDPESNRLKVAALNLFHPTASPVLREAVFSYCDTASGGRGSRGGGVYESLDTLAPALSLAYREAGIKGEGEIGKLIN